MKECRACKDSKSLLTPSGLCCLCYVYFGRKYFKDRYKGLREPEIQGCVKCGEGLTNKDSYCPEGEDCEYYKYQNAEHEEDCCDCDFDALNGELDEYGDPYPDDHSDGCAYYDFNRYDSEYSCGFDFTKHVPPEVNKGYWCRPCAHVVSSFMLHCARCSPTHAYLLRHEKEDPDYCLVCLRKVSGLGNVDCPSEADKSLFLDSTEQYLWSMVMLKPEAACK